MWWLVGCVSNVTIWSMREDRKDAGIYNYGYLRTVL